MSKITKQQQWNRYVFAINYCIGLGYYILPIFSNKSDNVKYIKVRNERNEECTVYLQPRKYKPEELFNLIYEKIKL